MPFPACRSTYEVWQKFLQARLGINMKWEQSWCSGQCALSSLLPLALKVQALSENSRGSEDPHHNMMSKANVAGPVPGLPVP